jgi:hypothetical protein
MNGLDWLDFDICEECGKKAAWIYISGELLCDKCVPRGCSCNMEPKDGNYENEDPNNWEEPTDEKGRKYPCCEWDKL